MTVAPGLEEDDRLFRRDSGLSAPSSELGQVDLGGICQVAVRLD